ncbi:MAG: WD40-repeat-containing domain protein [Olpidium bornovanus]|uniref:WD40-repeat-containing domain protein n=1 Tax=Olpidium bornovanus TaxID=278681 RepID=A0A8H8A1R7_9FUNG|nr:MAG: WD40-repeat-containing domain protein [Olpidium bornovanus]
MTDGAVPRPQQAYALVAHFLAQQGRRETLAQLLRECPDVFDADDAARDYFSTFTPRPPLVPLLAQFEEDRFREKMAAASLSDKERSACDDDLDRGAPDVAFPRKAGTAFEDIHNTNVIIVRTHELEFPATFLDRGGAGGEEAQGEEEGKRTRRVVVSAAADRTVKLSAAEDGEVLSICDHHRGPVLCLDFHPEHARLMATGSMDSSVALVDAATGRVMQRMRDHTKYVSRLAFTPGAAEHLVTGSYDGTLVVYRRVASFAPAGEDLVERNWADAAEAGIVPAGWPAYRMAHRFKFKGRIDALAVLPRSPNTVVVGVRDDNYLHYINLDALEDVKVNMNVNDDDWVSFSAVDISPSPSGEYVLVTTSAPTGRLILFETHTSRQVRNFYDPWLCSASAPGDVANELGQPRSLWHPSGRYVYSTAGGMVIRVFSVASTECVAELSGHKGVVRALWYQSDGGGRSGDRLVSCGFDKTIRYWDTEDAEDEEMVGA